MSPSGKGHLLEIKNMSVTYDLHVAVSEVSFKVHTNEVVALAGGNGSGKSTLMKTIAGALKADSGQIFWDGLVLEPGSAHQARKCGIEMVYQNCTLCPEVSVLENLFLGREIVSRLGFVRSKEMRNRASALIDHYHLPIPSLDVSAEKLSGGQQKAIAIGRALLSEPKLLLLDEPSAALGVKEQEIVIQTIKELHAKNVGVILCTHFPEEIRQVADRIIVLRNGKLQGMHPVPGMSKVDLALLMST